MEEFSSKLRLVEFTVKCRFANNLSKYKSERAKKLQKDQIDLKNTFTDFNGKIIVRKRPKKDIFRLLRTISILSIVWGRTGDSRDQDMKPPTTNFNC